MDYYSLVGPLVRMLDAETAHGLTVRLLKTGLVPAQPRFDPPALAMRLWGRDFANPIGLAAGFDKNAEVPDTMLNQGFGFVEIGSVTPRPQPGNPKPRMFRLPEDEAVINRMGFNNEGVEAAAARLAARRRVGIVGANLGKNKDTEDAAADYEIGAARLASLSDYLVINVSSPNTPGLRALQGRDQLESLVGRTRAALVKAMPSGAPPLLLKIAPDLAWEDLADIAAVALAGALDGLIISNTTVARPESLRSANAKETGGLSGAPLFEASTAVLRRMYELTQGKLPIIGVGGVASGSEAYVKIRAGASLVQLYSAMVYHGPGLVTRIKHELLDLLTRDGFASVAEAVGVDHREVKP
ncbi:dihydroorotate dehydrogenase (quinone) [Paramagnetospirillum kuznetsovii]|uniref:Dihydroorotate dehydrogenase (quinone) n=1 Tax=Paramagnetospirillum kuznetsovii TaxID=2053833 RepID=A0A364P3M4_9PROT|nr:quinone-dependent dihydroorotate dehydrogenase [Paramagnetospirillum kuznetsovii]RAU23948.1 dihydroorotate dehydrogenase (quinone) [Paramagnetospirillum kuznetsovii]